MKEDTVEHFINEAIPAHMKLMESSALQVAEMKSMVSQMCKSDKDKTAVFVRQIEKLSKRLDYAYSENAKLITLLTQANERYDRLYNLLEHHLTGNIINNSNN